MAFRSQRFQVSELQTEHTSAQLETQQSRCHSCEHWLSSAGRRTSPVSSRKADPANLASRHVPCRWSNPSRPHIPVSTAPASGPAAVWLLSLASSPKVIPTGGVAPANESGGEHSTLRVTAASMGSGSSRDFWRVRNLRKLWTSL